MNDQIGITQHLIADAGGLAHCDADAINHYLHRSINSITGYARPIHPVTGHTGTDLR